MENDTATSLSTTTTTTATYTHTTTDTEMSRNNNNPLPTPSTVPLPSIVSISTTNSPSTIPQTTTSSSPDVLVNILSSIQQQQQQRDDDDHDLSQHQSYHLSNNRILNHLLLSLRWLSPRQHHHRRHTLYTTSSDNISRTSAAVVAAATTTNTTALLYNTNTTNKSMIVRKVFLSSSDSTSYSKTSLLDHIRTVLCCSSTTTTIIPIGYIYTTITIAIISSMLLSALIFPKLNIPHVKVAMIGNSMIYYNDFPRFMEELSDRHITQNSCLHGNANFRTILQWGNGMFNLWDTGNARIFNFHKGRLHDYGACTVKQLLFGYDEALEQRVIQTFGNIYTEADDTAANEEDIDDAVAAAETDDGDISDDTVVYDYQKQYGDDYFSYNDGSNPCLRNPLYYKYLVSYVYSYHQNREWDYILLNDNTRSPARNESRQDMIQVLQDTYIPWFIETGAIPILLATYGYWTPYRDVGGLGTIPEFTSLTMAGYQSYVDIIKSQLPDHQQPRIAPVGLAFLLVWEENYSLWERLFHVDQIHSGPLGTYLQGLIVHHTIFGVLPKYSVAVRGDMSYLWHRARRFQPVEHHSDPYPTEKEAAYLYQIALRITVYKHVPKSFIVYTHGEASDYDPVDDAYKVDDLF